MKGNRNCDVLILNELVNNLRNDLKACLPLRSATSALNNERRLELFSSIQNGARPFKIIGIEGANSVMAFFCALQHGSCVNQHVRTSVSLAHAYLLRQ